ncbi:MAG: hypothetical protein QF805_12690 [Pirellulaceae bacterium]|nr:hypothetical protein [Pirellulaceae bacterium]
MHDRPTGFRRLMHRLEMDRAVTLAVLLRGWQFLGGAISALLITAFLSIDEQGYYYAFASALTVQTFFELGFTIVITNTASHEWSRLRLDDNGCITGEAESLSRLVSLGRLVFVWYAVAAILFLVAAGLGGYFYLLAREDLGIAWHGPWLAVVGLTALLLWALPFNALLEGCNQVATVNGYRLAQAITANAAVWILLVGGGGLWALVGAAGARLLVDLALICHRYRAFFAPFRRPPVSGVIDWRRDLWPMQWRLAISSAFHFFTASLIVLVIFHYHGPAAGGRMGMTWVLIGALQAAALAWVQTRVPRMGMLIAESKYDDLDRLFRRQTSLSVGVVAVGGSAIWLAVYAVDRMGLSIAGRLLPPTATGVYLLAILAYQIPQCMSFYIRAHKRDTLLGASVATSIGVGLTAWWFGSQYGPLQAGLGYLTVILCVTLPWHVFLWRRCKANHFA